MKIGEQSIDAVEAVAGGNEQAGVAAASAELAAGGGRFQCAYRGGADGDNPAAAQPGLPHGLRTIVADMVNLAVHTVLA